MWMQITFAWKRSIASCHILIFYTIDVANSIGKPADPAALAAFLCRAMPS